MFHRITTAMTCTAVCLSIFFLTAVVRAGEIDLVLQITVDQLRGDFPLRFRERFGEGGFRYLMDNGVVYVDAHFRHANTFTAVGHATLSTGGYSAQHGFPGNEWYDQSSGQRIYCVADYRYPIIGRSSEEYGGASPRRLTSSTIGDELVLATAGKSRVFSVSVKDRGAIIPGGHRGKAYWYDKKTGEFITSRYYYDDYPAWVKKWNAAKHADRYRDQSWRLLHDRATYVYGHLDGRSWEKSFKDLGRTFPHPLDNSNPEDFYSGLRFTPMGDALTLDFVKTLVKQEGLGQGEQPDFLAVSFSATDYIGHVFGPNSLEYEDNILRLDTTLAGLFAFIDQTVGLERTLIVLSSDHGIDEIPEYKQSLGFDAGRHDVDSWLMHLDMALQRHYQSDKNFIVGLWNPSIYLNLETVQGLDLDIEAVEQTLRELILNTTGIAWAVTRTELLRGEIANTPIMHMLQRAFHPRRSGNVLIVQEPFWFLHPQASGYAAMHGSPYSYDTYVPIMFSGPGIGPRYVSRKVAPADIAPSIAAYLGIKPPSGSVGDVLSEVLEHERSLGQGSSATMPAHGKPTDHRGTPY
ncbi:MAG: alkaline phosphatase family protein [Pseudomonadota bacterium]